MKQHVKMAAASAAKWALGLCAGFVLGPVLLILTSGSDISGNLIAQKLVTAVALYPLLFVSIWAWGVFGKKQSSETGNVQSPPRATPPPPVQSTSAQNAAASRKPNKWNYVGIGAGAFMLLFLFIPEMVKGTLANQYYLGGAFWVAVIIFCSINIARARNRGA